MVVLARPRRRAASGSMITSSASMPSASRSRSFMRRRRSLASHQSRDWSRVSPVAVSAWRWSRPMRRRCSRTSGTPPARNTCTVGWLRGPLGSASTSRGVARLTRCQSATVGRAEARRVGDGGKVQHEVGGAAEGGVGQHRVLDRLGGEDAREGDAEGGEPQQGESRAPGDVQPDRLAGRGRARCAGGRGRGPRPPPARWPRCPGTGSPRRASRRRGRPGPAACSRVTSPWAKRAPRVCTVPASSPDGRGQRHAAGHDHARQVGDSPRGRAWSRAGPCRRWRRPGRPRGAAASGSAAA